MKTPSFNKSEKYFQQAKKYIPGGVNSPVRAFKAVGMEPLFIQKAKGAYIYDEDGNRYIDYCLSWGPMILGHADKRVVKSICDAAKKGSTFGAPTKQETELARLVCGAYPSIEELRLTSSGTEAAMSAIRLARGFTGREKIIKFEGCYHGHSDCLLVKAGSGSATFGVPSSRGVIKSAAEDTIVLPFNNIEKIEEVVKSEKGNIACVIVEPVPANMGVILPKPGFLKRLRQVTKENNIILIFDEVITGFRVALGGAQEVFGIKPDLTVLGKILGGGMPLAGFGGMRQIMSLLSPDGPVYQAGTLSGNPVAVAAGICTVKALIKGGVYKPLEQKGAQIEAGIKRLIAKSGKGMVINRIGSLFTLFFTDRKEIMAYDDVKMCDLGAYARFFRGMLSEGVYLAPSQFEANFISVKHTPAAISKTLAAVGYVLNKQTG